MLARLTLTTLALLGLSATALAATPQDDTSAGLIGLTDDAEQVDTTLERSTRPNQRRTTAQRANGNRGPASARTVTTTRTTTVTRTSRPGAIPAGPPAPAASRSSHVRPAGPAVGPGYRTSSPHRSTSGHHRRPAHSAHHSRPHTRPPAISHHYRPHRHRVVVYHHVRPYHGVFVYGPRPTYHSHYHYGRQADVRRGHLPTRRVDRDDSLALGLRTGALYSGYDNGIAYGDFGLGATLRYRPEESVGLELALTHHDEAWEEGTERAQTMAQGSVMVFAFPWARVSPYALGGMTYLNRSIDDSFVFDDCSEDSFQSSAPLWGPHGGVGIELALGESVALDLEARYVGYLNTSIDEPTLPGSVQTSAGLLVHF